ncbi:Prenylated Rab acceptor 1 [Yarrowia sp. C11]|nr:Prenylated Rab acceptor 1 [Yarrowia sp. E02]KAG5367399.1 Prenylated Rab acceptor 1 [Yarrowia sp. C11]
MDAITSMGSSSLSGLSERFNLERLRTEGANLQNRFANLKSPTDFFDVRRISKPPTWGEAQARINFNLGYFSTNYAIIFGLLSLYSLLTNWLLLFVIGFVFLGLYGISFLGGSDLNLGFTTLTSSQLYTGLMIVAIPLGFFASPISTVLWIVGSSGFLIIGHAALLEKPIESAFEEVV